MNDDGSKEDRGPTHVTPTPVNGHKVPAVGGDAAFDRLPQDMKSAIAARMVILDGMVELNRRYFIALPPLDPGGAGGEGASLMPAGTVYDRQPEDGGVLRNAADVIRTGRATAEESVAYVGGLLRARGEDARPEYFVEERPSSRAIVIIPRLRRGDGSVEMPWEKLRKVAL